MLPKFLKSTGYPLEKHFFLMPRFCLRLVGFYPETRQTWLTKIWAFINFLNLITISTTSLYFGILLFWENVPAALDAVCPDASSIMSLVKMLCIWYYRDRLKLLIERVRKLLALENSNEKIEVKRQYFTTATRLIFTVFFLGFWTATSYVIRTDLKSILRYFRGEPTDYETPYNSVFPEFSMHLPWFPFTLVYSHWYGYVTVFCFAAGDGLFCSFCFYITCLLKALAFDLRDLMANPISHNKQHDIEDNELFYKLTLIVQRYNEIANIMEEFSDVMVVLTLAQFVTSSMVIGISAINLLLFPGYGMVLYVFYTSCVMCEIFLYCAGGTSVIESSYDLALVAYLSPWYDKSVRVQKMLLTLITRTQRSLVVKVPFFAPSLPVLTSILRTTGSLIALANSLLH